MYFLIIMEIRKYFELNDNKYMMMKVWMQIKMFMLEKKAEN